MIRFVFLDIDETLLDFKKSEAIALSGTLSELGIEPKPNIIALYSRINREQWNRLELGKTTREELVIKRYEILFSELGVEHDPALAQSIYEDRLSRSAFYLPDARELLAVLRGRYKVYLASNGTAKVQDGRIAVSGIDKYVDGIFLSERLGYDKPNPKFFYEAFKSIPDFDPASAIMVGDNLGSDILGGINAGILTCYYNPNGKKNDTGITPDYEIQRLKGLPTLLEAIKE